MDKSIVVIIPVHKETLSKDEQLSLKQCERILGNYHVYLLYPSTINVDAYTAIFPSLNLKPVQNDWLSSLEAYNKMKRDLSFYKLFEDYNYLLTYELDAWIFSDDWEKAHCFEYDFIGAPWFKGWKETDNPSDVSTAGNSGFSLRNIHSCISILQKIEERKSAWNKFSKLQLHRIIKFSWFVSYSDKKSWRTQCENVYFFQLFSNAIMEDIFWADVVPKVFNFNVGNIKDSISFSFEINPRLLHKMNNYQLPIGCHAWKKYDPAFWEEYILSN